MGKSKNKVSNTSVAAILALPHHLCPLLCNKKISPLKVAKKMKQKRVSLNKMIKAPPNADGAAAELSAMSMRDESIASQSLRFVDEEEDEEQDSFPDSQDNFLAPEAMSLNVSKISAVKDPLSDSLSVMETSLAKDNKSTAKVLTKPNKKAAIVATVADIHPALQLAAR
jgi:hypothetical protein